MAIVIAAFVLGGALTIALYATWFLRAEGKTSWPPALVARRRALGPRVAALAGQVPRATVQVDQISVPGAAEIDADLFAGNYGRALAAAEALVAADPDDGDRQLLLCRVLLAVDQPLAAERAARRAASSGVRGPRLDLCLGLAAHLARIERAPSMVETDVTYPTLLTAFELFILELERHRRRGKGATALWLARLGDTSLTTNDLLAAVVEHVSAYCDDLEHLCAAAEADPALIEASYHAARLAVKLGLIEPARALFDALEPVVAGNPVETAYRRDVAALRDQVLPPVLEPAAPPLSSGRRSVALKILK